jgi:hypothetical protein
MKEHTFALPHGFRTKAELTGFANHAITLPKRLPWGEIRNSSEEKKFAFPPQQFEWLR